MDSNTEQHVIPPLSPPPFVGFDDFSDEALSEEDHEGSQCIDIA